MRKTISDHCCHYLKTSPRSTFQIQCQSHAHPERPILWCTRDFGRAGGSQKFDVCGRRQLRLRKHDAGCSCPGPGQRMGTPEREIFDSEEGKALLRTWGLDQNTSRSRFHRVGVCGSTGFSRSPPAKKTMPSSYKQLTAFLLNHDTIPGFIRHNVRRATQPETKP